jgi:hypothetical protein
MVVLCKRCGRALKSAKSIELGYGPTCYKIINSQDKSIPSQDNSITIQEEIKFLKMEIQMLKYLMRDLKTSKVLSHHAPPIMNVRKEEKNPERNANQGQMMEVIQELKTCFQNCNGDVKSLLRPIQIESTLVKTSKLAIV